MQSLKDTIKEFGTWAQENWDAVVIFATLLLLIFCTLILASWLYGYWSNGIWGTKFELNTVWGGVGAVITGAGSVFGLAQTSNSKYKTDSQYNSKCGEPVNINDILGTVGGTTTTTSSTKTVSNTQTYSSKTNQTINTYKNDDKYNP